jgi:hypothetical protein
VTAWLTESMAHDTLPDTYPDGIVALQGDAGSAVLCLEIDEATEPGPVIRDKFSRYDRALWSRVWYLLFVTGSPERAARLATFGRGHSYPGIGGKAWALVLPELRAKGLDAPILSLTVGARRSTLGALLTDPHSRRCPTPVGSDAWLRLLGGGGIEDDDEALA